MASIPMPLEDRYASGGFDLGNEADVSVLAGSARGLEILPHPHPRYRL